MDGRQRGGGGWISTEVKKNFKIKNRNAHINCIITFTTPWELHTGRKDLVGGGSRGIHNSIKRYREI